LLHWLAAMKRVYATVDRVEAEVLCALLRDAGIEPALDDSAVGLAPAPVGIHVRDEDAASAAEVLARHFEKDAKDSEADPEAPEPLPPEEAAQFEERVAKGRVRLGFWVDLIGIAFWGLWIYYYGRRGDAAKLGLGLGCLLLWLTVNRVAGILRKKKEPAS